MKTQFTNYKNEPQTPWLSIYGPLWCGCSSFHFPHHTLKSHPVPLSRPKYYYTCILAHTSSILHIPSILLRNCPRNLAFWPLAMSALGTSSKTKSNTTKFPNIPGKVISHLQTITSCMGNCQFLPCIWFFSYISYLYNTLSIKYVFVSPLIFYLHLHCKYLEYAWNWLVYVTCSVNIWIAKLTNE